MSSTRACDGCGREAGFHTPSCASADRLRQRYLECLAAARQAAARAVQAMEAFALVATGPWRHSPKLAAERVTFEIEFAAEDEEKRHEEEAKRG